ncbi:NUDIX domain-containing protein [Prauserella oleivorans]
MEFDDAQAWLRAHQTLMEPLAAEVWVTDPSYSHVLLVRHRVRGWVPPGGKVEPGETPRQPRPVNSWRRPAWRASCCLCRRGGCPLFPCRLGADAEPVLRGRRQS